MDTILVIKLLAIGITVFYMFRNGERTSNWIGGLLVASFGLTLMGIGTLATIAVILYLTTLLAALFLVLTQKIENDQRTLFSVFLVLAVNQHNSYIAEPPEFRNFRLSRDRWNTVVRIFSTQTSNGEHSCDNIHSCS